jgi:ABC-2 type transport system permease protein
MGMGMSSAATGLRPVDQPSVLGPSLRRFRTLVWLNAVAEFKLMYVGSALGSVLGYLWALARPLLSFLVIYIVFSKVLGIGGVIPHFAGMLLLNLTLFFFFVETAGRSTHAFVANEGVLRRTQFPRAAVPVSIVLTGLFTFCLNLVAVFAIVLAVGTPPLWTWLLLPLLWLAMLVITLATSLLLSTLFVRFRDVAQIWSVLAGLLFYTSPIMYPVERVPSGFHWLLIINPLAPLFELMRVWTVQPSAPTPLEVTGNVWGLLGPCLVFAAVCIAGLAVIRRGARTIAEDL